MSLGSSLNMLRPEVPGFDSRQEGRNFLLVTATQSPTQWVTGTLYPGVKRPGHDAEFIQFNAWSCTSSPPYVFMLGFQAEKQR